MNDWNPFWILLLLIVLHLRMVFQFNFLSHMYGCSYECNMMFLCVNLPQQLIVMHNASRAQWSPGSWPIIEFARRTISGRQIVWDFALCYNYACWARAERLDNAREKSTPPMNHYDAVHQAFPASCHRAQCMVFIHLYHFFPVEKYAKTRPFWQKFISS